MKTTRTNLLLAVLATCSSPALCQTWQSPVVALGSDVTKGFTTSVREHDLEKLIGKALNSDGDSIDFSVSIEGSRRGKGAEGDLALTCKRVGGGYELLVAGSVMKTVGFDVKSTVSAQAKHGGKATAVLAFDEPVRLRQAISTLAYLNVLKPIEVRSKLRDALERLTGHDNALSLALDAVNKAKKIKDEAFSSLTKLRGKANDAIKEFDKLKGKLKDAQKKLDDAKKKCDKAWPISEALKKALDAAKSVLKGIEKSYDKAKSVMNKAIDLRDKAKKAFDRAQADTAKSVRDSELAAELTRGSKLVVDGLRTVVDAIDDLQTFLGVRLRAVTFDRSAGLDVSASAKDNGIDLGTTDLEVEASTLVSASMRFDLPTKNEPMWLTISAVHEGAIDLTAKANSGFRVAATGKIAIEAAFEIRPSSMPRFSFQRSGTRCVFDMEALATNGKVASLETGVGRTVAFFIDSRAWSAAAERANLVFSSNELRRGLANVATRVTVQDRTIVGVSASYERSKNNSNVKIEGGLHWHDRGPAMTMTENAANVLATLIRDSWLKDQLRGLQAAHAAR